MLLKILDIEAFRRDALPQRFQGFHDDLKLTRGVTSPHDMEDQYDRRSIQFGLYHHGEIVCSWRLITTDSFETLPTTKLLRNVIQQPRSAIEFSKLVVAVGFRGCGIASVALRASMLEARRRVIEQMLISVIDEPRFVGFLCRLGFVLVAEGFFFEDEKIAATSPAAAYSFAIAEIAASTLEMESQLDRLMEEVEIAIETQRLVDS